MPIFNHALSQGNAKAAMREPGRCSPQQLVNTWQDASLETMPCCSFVCVVISVLNALKKAIPSVVKHSDRATNVLRLRHIAAMPPKFPVHTLQTEALTTTVVREVKSM